MHTRRLVKRSVLGSRVYAPGVSPVAADGHGAPGGTGMPPPDSRDGSSPAGAPSSGAPPLAPGMMKSCIMNGCVDPQRGDGGSLSPEALEEQQQQQHRVCCVESNTNKRFGPSRSSLDPDGPRSVSLLEQKRKVVVSSSIDVPHARRSEAEADMDKVTAAMVLTSLSTSPLVRSPPVKVSEGLSGSWKDSSSASGGGGGPFTPSSYSSSGGYWSWSAPSDQSNPSTPSPPLSADSFKPFRMPSLGGCGAGGPGGGPGGGGGGGGLGPEDPSLEEQDGSSLLFDEPIPRKRKNSMKVMFKCLWKNCGKVLSTAAGIQRHIRTAHLGRNCDSESSDGEEDFYYTEIKLNTDSVADGLSSLSPVSPCPSVLSSSCPPAAPPPPPGALPPSAPHPSAPHQSSMSPSCVLPPPLHPPSSAETRGVTTTAATTNGGGGGTPLSRSAPSALYLIHADHAYQATAPVSIPSSNTDSAGGSFTPTNGNTFSISWQSPPVSFTGNSVSPSKSQGFEQRAQTIAVLSSPPRATGSLSRKVRGEGKKCRKVYGMENRDMWCTACRWKKACQRFTD